METNGDWVCKACLKSYKSKGGYYKHIKGCNQLGLPSFNSGVLVSHKLDDTNGLDFKLLQKDNEMLKKELEILKLQLEDKAKQLEDKDKMIELLQQQLLSKPPSYVDMSNNIVSNNTTNQNNTFNINFYLNETCKNAINLNELINYIPNDVFTKQNLLECKNIQELLTKGIRKGLDSIPQIERPIQTTDIRRHKYYYKLNNEWIKNTAELANEIVKTIKTVHHKNIIPLCIELNKETMENRDNDKLSIINNKLIVKSSLVDVKLDPIVNDLVDLCKVEK